MSLSNCVKYEKNIHPMSLMTFVKRDCCPWMQRRPLIRISLEIQFCQSSVWHCALRRTLTSVLINNVPSDAYCLCYEIPFEKSKGEKDNHKSKLFKWDLQRRKSAARRWKVQFVYSWWEKENFQATRENVKLPLFGRRKSDCLTTIWGWERYQTVNWPERNT